MKKILMSLLALGLLAGGAAAQVYEKPVMFSANIGLLYDSEESGLAQWGFDLRAGIRLGRHFQLSPEVMFAGSPGHSFFYPGVLVNYMAKRMFAGAGVVKPVEMVGLGDTSLAAKFVLGYVRGPVMVTVFFMGSVETDQYTSLFEHYRIGASVGFRF